MAELKRKGSFDRKKYARCLLVFLADESILGEITVLDWFAVTVSINGNGFRRTGEFKYESVRRGAVLSAVLIGYDRAT